MSILKKLKSLAPALSAVVVAACIGVSLHGYSTPVYAVDIPETTKNQTDEDTSEQENADTAEKEKKEDKKKDEDKKEEQKSTAKGSFDVSDGTYYGTGTGFAGKIKVAVTVKDKQITAIEIVENEADDDTFFSRAKGVIDKIISGQTLDVDVVSGATYSSNGIISAVKNALTGAADSGTPASTSAGASGGSSSPAGGVFFYLNGTGCICLRRWNILWNRNRIFRSTYSRSSDKRRKDFFHTDYGYFRWR